MAESSLLVGGVAEEGGVAASVTDFGSKGVLAHDQIKVREPSNPRSMASKIESPGWTIHLSNQTRRPSRFSRPAKSRTAALSLLLWLRKTPYRKASDTGMLHRGVAKLNPTKSITNHRYLCIGRVAGSVLLQPESEKRHDRVIRRLGRSFSDAKAPEALRVRREGLPPPTSCDRPRARLRPLL